MLGICGMAQLKYSFRIEEEVLPTSIYIGKTGINNPAAFSTCD
jgi:hypothetical protein